MESMDAKKWAYQRSVKRNKIDPRVDKYIVDQLMESITLHHERKLQHHSVKPCWSYNHTSTDIANKVFKEFPDVKTKLRVTLHRMRLHIGYVAGLLLLVSKGIYKDYSTGHAKTKLLYLICPKMSELASRGELDEKYPSFEVQVVREGMPQKDNTIIPGRFFVNVDGLAKDGIRIMNKCRKIKKFPLIIEDEPSWMEVL